MRKDIETIRRMYYCLEDEKRLEKEFKNTSIRQANSRGFEWLCEYKDIVDELILKRGDIPEEVSDKKKWLKNVFKTYRECKAK